MKITNMTSRGEVTPADAAMAGPKYFRTENMTHAEIPPSSSSSSLQPSPSSSSSSSSPPSPSPPSPSSSSLSTSTAQLSPLPLRMKSSKCLISTAIRRLLSPMKLLSDLSSFQLRRSTKLPPSVGNLFIAILLISFSLRTSYCIDTVCQEQTSSDTMAYHVCMVDPKNIFIPNNTNYNLSLNPVDSTCGVGDSVQYCNMTIPLQCGACNSTFPHPKEYMVDFQGTIPNLYTWWQSKTWYQLGARPQVDITISLGRRYILQDDIKFTFANQRPKQAILEKSMDNGVTWIPLQYYNVTCDPSAKTTVTNPDDVICATKYSDDYPNSGGELSFDVNVDRFGMYLGPFFNNWDSLYTAYQNTNLLDFLTFTDLRLRLIYPATDGQEINGRDFDKLKYFYAVSNIYLLAGCDCNRHAKYCNLVNNQMVCSCEHNTAGNSCETCLPLYNNRPWQKGSFLPLPSGQGNECQICNCNNRSTSCYFDPTINQGRCNFCTNNTQGDNCQTCTSGYYKNSSASLGDPTICILCNCEAMGTFPNTTCQEASGQCSCKGSVLERRCDQCFAGLWGLLTNDTSRGTCKACNCNTAWTVNNSNVCDQNTGQCICLSGVFSLDCSLCADGYYRNPDINFPRCDPCMCDAGGSKNLTCDKASGQCYCQPNLIGARCHFPSIGYFIPLPDRINLKPDQSPQTTCTWKTGLKTASIPFSGQFYYSCLAGQSAVFTNILGSIKKQGNVSQIYIPAIRYTLNDSSPLSHATLTISSQGLNNNFNATFYPNISSTLCDPNYPVVIFDMYNLPPGIGMSWINMTALANIDARCLYRVEFKSVSAGATTTPFLLDSLVFIPDVNLSLAFKIDPSDANRNQYVTCVQNQASSDQSTISPCSDFFTSFMAEQTGEALPCECSTVGSSSPNCTSLGGSCTCKANVGGRACDFCQPGFFALSDQGCQSCDCNTMGSSSPVCNYTTGQCPCYQNVAQLGQNSTNPIRLADKQCSLCMVNYYGISSGQGCQSCDCNPQGSASLQCSEDGTCPCKPTIGGQKCDQCLPGYFGFSVNGCQQCNCSAWGSINGTCGNGGQCFCKSTNVIGIACDQCKDGFFGLSYSNPDGCQPCVCSGFPSTTSFCHSAVGFRQDVITSFDASSWPFAPDLLDYVLAPTQFLGDRRSSYGQFLNFTALPMDAFLAGYIQYVIMESTNGRRIFYPIDNQSFSLPTNFNIQLHESKWKNDSNPSTPLTANDFYNLLSKLSRLMIQKIFLKVHTVNPLLISLISAAPTTDPSVPMINYVENCTCSSASNTAGLSCEKCQQGFKRSSNDSSASCVPCTCQRMTANQTCDELTGQCLNCPNGSLGWSCEQLAPNVIDTGGVLQCIPGFYGLSKTGCQACACSTIGSTNPSTCDVKTGQCTCRPNVDGMKCDRCKDGFVNLTMTGCSTCSQCYMLVVDEIKAMSDMLNNQTDALNKANSTITSDFLSRLTTAEVNSTFLNTFNNDFASKELNFNTTLTAINETYPLLNDFINSTLDQARNDSMEWLIDIKSSLDYADNLLREAITELLDMYNGFDSMRADSDLMQRLADALHNIRNSISNSVFNVQYGFQVLNDTVTRMEALSLELSNLVNLNLSQVVSQAVANNSQLVNNLDDIEQRVNALNSSSLDLRNKTLEVKRLGEVVLGRITQVSNLVSNLNLSTLPDMQSLDVRLAVNIPNRAADQQTRVNNLLNDAAGPNILTQNITQLTNALTARVTDLLNQINSMSARVNAANLTASNAFNLSITTYTNAANMFDAMSRFQEKSDALRSQANSAILSAQGFTTGSNNALQLANNITASLDQILPISQQALSMSNDTQTRCQTFGQNLYPVRVRSDQLKAYSDSVLNDVPLKQSTVNTIVLSTSNENVLAAQTDAANQLTNRVISLRNSADQLNRNVTAVGQRLADIANQLSSKIPLPIDLLRDLLNRCQDTKNRLNQLSQSSTVQSLQSSSSTNQQWVAGLAAKRQDLRIQLDRLKTVVGKLTKT